MSNKEDTSPSPRDATSSVDDSDDGREKGQDEYEPAISAKPPKVHLQEESQVEVSASPAFQCLDDVSIKCI